jgi:hypothetical protein
MFLIISFALFIPRFLKNKRFLGKIDKKFEPLPARVKKIGNFQPPLMKASAYISSQII